MAPYRNLEEYNLEVTGEVKDRYSKIITEIGENVDREGLLKTPERAAKAMLFLTQGYKQDAVEILKSAMFQEDYDDMVIIKDIELYSFASIICFLSLGRPMLPIFPTGILLD